MKRLNLKKVERYVSKNIASFHANKLRILDKLTLDSVLKKKNPYLFRAKGYSDAGKFINDAVEAFLSSSEEGIFGGFLEDLAVFIAQQTMNGRKGTNIDIEFEHKATRYLVAIKSGTNWGNSRQHKEQERDFKNAVKVLKQSNHTANVQPVIGICYGKTKTSFVRGHMKVVGQNFWYFISGNTELYKQIIQPLGDQAKERNDEFVLTRDKHVNLFYNDFVKRFCEQDGSIKWEALVEFNCGNLDLDTDFNIAAKKRGKKK